jgi:nitrogen fixation protein NifX
MPGSIRVAVASNSGEMADGHFGSCARFLVYQVSKEESRLIGLRSTLEADDSDDRNAFRTDLIRDCQIVYVVSVGGPAAAKIIRAGVYPIKLKEESPAGEVIAKLQQVLAGSPPPWLAKIMGVSAEERMRFQAEKEEDWAA